MSVSRSLVANCTELPKNRKIRNVQKTSSVKGGNENMDIDWRVAIVLLPVILAGSWALFNIAPVAIRQVQAFLNK
jgi:photosystem II PsbY protein